MPKVVKASYLQSLNTNSLSVRTYYQEIQYYLSLGELERIFALMKKFPQLDPSIKEKWLLLSGRYYKNENDLDLGILSKNSYDLENNRINNTISNFLKRQKSTLEKNIHLPIDSPYSKQDIFISYSHRNTEHAFKVKKRLEDEGINVQIDDYGMHPGIDVYGYIRKAVNNTRFTLSIISSHSLLSTWVAMETLEVFKNEDVFDHPKFIPCYIDREFMNPSFTLESIRKIDTQIKEIDTIINQQNAINIDSRNLVEDKTRLYQLRNNLDKIIGRLKRTKCMNISEPYFEANLTKIAERILKK